jgi:hypothetical protein
VDKEGYVMGKREKATAIEKNLGDQGIGEEN